MKKLLICLSFLSACCWKGIAQTVTVADVEALPGETVSFVLDLGGGKIDSYTSLQFNAEFPISGFSTTGDYTISPRWKNATAVIGDVDSEGVAIIPVSSAEAISASEVTGLLSVDFKVSEEVVVGDYEIKLSKITFGYGFTDKDIAPDVIFNVHVVDVHTVVLNESSIEEPKEASGVIAQVNRTIPAGVWSTICLPFSMSSAQVKDAFGENVIIGDFEGYDVSDDGESIMVHFSSSSVIVDNHPYIIKVNQTISEFTVNGVDINPGEEPMVNKGTKRKPKAFVGTYVANTIIANGCLFLSDNKFWYSTGNTKMKAFRAYFDFDDLLPDFEDNYAESRISLVFDDDTTTGISSLSPSLSQGVDAVYDLQGRRVDEPKAKGIYIVNGKKIKK